MAGNTKHLQLALGDDPNKIIASVVGSNDKVTDVTGAMVIGALQAGDDMQERIIALEAENAKLKAADLGEENDG